MKEIELIKNMIDKCQFDSDVLFSILESFGEDIALIPLLLLEHQKIVRSRINDKKDLFYEVSDLSYPPSHCVIRTDRASLKGHPMFYASVFTSEAEKTGALPRIVSAMETLNILKEVHTNQQCIFTQSLWQVKENVHVFAFPVSEKYKRACSELGMFRDGWENFCKDYYTKDSIEFFSFIGDLMATPGSPSIYQVTATCVDYIIRKFDFEGIVYPSVPTEGEGLNVCLTPKVVDEKICFEDAIAEMVFRTDMESEIEVFACIQKVSKTSFNWKVTEYGKKQMNKLDVFPHFKESDEVILVPKYRMEK